MSIISNLDSDLPPQSILFCKSFVHTHTQTNKYTYLDVKFFFSVIFEFLMKILNWK